MSYCVDVEGEFCFFFFFQAEDGIRDVAVTGVQTCALPIFFTTAQFWYAVDLLPSTEWHPIMWDDPTRGLQKRDWYKDLNKTEIGRAHVWTPVTATSRMPSSA